MKILGISFGRKGQNCDIVCKQALLAAKKSGAEVEFINTCHLNIDRCTGCGACDRRMEKGGPCRCVIKDDFPFLEEHILEADGIILSAPVYVLGPVGQFKNLTDRLGPSHDRAYMMQQQQKRIAEGKTEEELMDERLFKDRFLGLISVGGARTENWTSLGLLNMHLFAPSMQMTVVDQMNVYGMGDRVSPVLDESLMERLAEMGEHVAASVGTPREEAKWYGDDPGLCPVCHNRTFTIKDARHVECPICGMYGELKLQGKDVRVEFSPEQIAQCRYRTQGVIDHRNEIDSMTKRCIRVIREQGEQIKELLKPLDEIQELDRKEFTEK